MVSKRNHKQPEAKSVTEATLSAAGRRKPDGFAGTDIWFNPYRCPATERGRALVAEVIDGFTKPEKRERARSAVAQSRLECALSALASDLAYYHLNGCPGTGLVVPRGKATLSTKSRYRSHVFSHTFPEQLNQLASQDVNYVTQDIGEYSGLPGQSKLTTVRPSRKLVSLFEKHKVTFDDFKLSDAEEVIILKRKKHGRDDKGGRQEYDDTPLTRQLRADMRGINAWLESADITFDSAVYEHFVDARKRRLYRTFSEGRFDRNGRLSGGFWQNQPKPVRLDGIAIEGESVIELDYAQLNPTLAYAAVGLQAPQDDAYTLPGLEDCREGVKKLFNALLFDEKPRDRFPKNTKHLFPAKTKGRDVIASIHQRHSKLAPVLSSGVGLELMFQESEIMMRVLRRLREKGIVGLPIHDAVIVKASRAEEAKVVMLEQFKEATGRDIAVRLEQA